MYKNYLNKNWTKSLLKYEFIKSQKEKNIQSSFFLDYFIQSINVANRSNDLICCSNSVEPRNIFISKILQIPYEKKIKQKVLIKSLSSEELESFVKFNSYMIFYFISDFKTVIKIYLKY